MVMNNNEQRFNGPQADAVAPTPTSVLARLTHLFRLYQAEDTDNRFLFELVRRYRLGESQ